MPHRELFRNLLWPQRYRSLDLEHWAAYACEMGATSLCLEIKSQAHAMYDSAWIARDPELGDRDLAAEVSSAARGKGLAWTAYLAPAQLETLHDAHPEWLERLADGTSVAEASGGYFRTSFCWNSPYLDLFCKVAEEITRRYRPDGLFIDGMRFQGRGTRVSCYCDFCQQRFRDETGHTLPDPRENSDPGSDCWREFYAARQRWIADATRQLSERVKSVNPLCTLYLNNKYGGGDCAATASARQFQHVDVLCREAIPQSVRGSLSGGPYGFSAGDLLMWRCALQRAAKRGEPGQLYLSLSPVTRPADIDLAVDLACANGCHLSLQERRDDTARYLQRAARLAPWMNHLQRRPEILLHSSERALLQAPGSNRTTTASLYKMLADLQRQTDLVLDEDLNDGLTEPSRPAAPLIILAGSSVLSQAAGQHLQLYVEQGGCLWAAAGTDLHRQEHASQELLFRDSGLRILGLIHPQAAWSLDTRGSQVTFQDPVPPDPAQWLIFQTGSTEDWLGDPATATDHPCPAEERELFHLTDRPSVLLPTPAWQVEADERWQVLATLRYLDSHTSEWAELPAILSRPIGQGHLLYTCFDPGALFAERTLWSDIGYAWSRHLVQHLVEQLIGPASIAIQAPACVKSMIWHRDKELLIHLVNELSSQSAAIQLEERLPVMLRLTLPGDWQTLETVVGPSCEISHQDSCWQVHCAALSDRLVLRAAASDATA